MKVSSPPEKGAFITAKPKSASVKPHIAYYYFHEKETGEPVEFVFYPHTRCGLTTYKNSKTVHSPRKATTRPDPSVAYTQLYSSIIDQSVHVTMVPPFRKIGVAFHPLGINHFIRQPLNSLLDCSGSEFNYFLDDMKSTLDKVYAHETIDDKIKILDGYFEKCLVHFLDERLIAVVDLILNTAEKVSVQDLADSQNISRKTLLRLFKLHLNCSVKDYLNVVQFRKAISTYQAAKRKMQLSEVAHSTNYYDQSDFIKHFKKITGFNPKKIFAGIEHIGEEDTFWTFKD